MEEEQNCKKGKKRVDSAVLSVHAAIFLRGRKFWKVLWCNVLRQGRRLALGALGAGLQRTFSLIWLIFGFSVRFLQKLQDFASKSWHHLK